MSANANIVEPVQGKSSLVRPKFSPGLLLRDDDLRQGVDYTRDLSRLLFRSFFGCGVVCGLTVKPTLECDKLIVTVDKGIALDGRGDPIYVPEPTKVKIDPTCGKEIPAKLWVLLCRTEKCCAPRTAVCGDDEDAASVCTREHDGFEIKVVKEEPKSCACTCPYKKLPPPSSTAAPASSTSDGAVAQDAAGTTKKQTAAEVRKAAEAQKALDAQAAMAAANPHVEAATQTDCWCAAPCDACYKEHYQGKCGCECCDEDCVVLAAVMLVDRTNTPVGTNRDNATWKANHSFRRFIRPVLMRDPQVWEEQHPGKDPCATTAAT